MKKLLLPVTILLASIVLGGSYYMVQVNKQKSTEKQQQVQLQEDRRIEEVRVEKEKADGIFNDSVRCKILLNDLKQRWNNIIGIYYSESQNTCIVQYNTQDGEIEESPIEEMQDI